MPIHSNLRRARLFSFCMLLAGGYAVAADVVIKVTGTNSSQGQVGCALFDSSPAFPMDNAGTRQVWLAADSRPLICKFSGIAAGAYAVAVSHDLNGNKKVDTNFLGIPKEGWAVSNNVVPNLRAPRFDESQFFVKEGSTVELEVKLVY